MKNVFNKEMISVSLICAGLFLMNSANAVDNLVLPGDLTVNNSISTPALTSTTGTITAPTLNAANINLTGTLTAPSLKGSLSGKVNYTTIPAVTVTKKAGDVSTTIPLNVSSAEGFCFLSGWNSVGNLSSCGWVDYANGSWRVTAGCHDNVKATAICLKWQP